MRGWMGFAPLVFGLVVAAPPGARAQPSVDELRLAGSGLERAAAVERRLGEMLEAAREERDTIRVTCVGDKLTQVRALRRVAENHARSWIEALVGREAARAHHEAQVLGVTGERADALQREAENCIGQDVMEVGTTQLAIGLTPAWTTRAESERVEILTRGRAREMRVLEDEFREIMAESSGGAENSTPAIAPDAGGDRTLIYRAALAMSVFEIAARQAEILAIAAELEGYLDSQSGDELTIRVPAPRFQEALERIADVGEIVARQIEVRDVSEQHRDLGIRLQNAEVTRDRLLRLLEQARTVEDILRVESQLERVTLLVEQLRGELRALDGHIAMSTIQIRFRPAPVEGRVTQHALRLPVPWLDELGIGPLLDLGGSGR